MGQNNFTQLLLPLGAQSGTFTGPAIPLYQQQMAAVYAKVTAVAGTLPILVLQIQGSPDGVNDWYDISDGLFASISVTGNFRIPLAAVPDNYIRIKGVITGVGANFTLQAMLTGVGMQ